jgi:SAM-dependent methyltransferase
MPQGLDRARRAAKRSRLGVIGVRVAKDRLSGLRTRARIPTRSIGATHREFDLDGSVDYVQRVFADYLRYGDVRREDLAGSDVLELGPGDNLGVALCFVGAGAKVRAIDRFVAWGHPERDRAIYARLIEQMAPGEAERARSVIGASGIVEPDGEAIEVVRGTGIERATEIFGPASFDLIVSRAVVEHLYDTEAAFRTMDVLLRPGGRMAHKIDIRDHGMFTEGGQHPLSFLTVSPRVYGWMARNSGLPNRMLVDHYRRLVEEAGYEYEMYVTHLIGEETELEPHPLQPPETEMHRAGELAEAIRGKLAAPFRDTAASDLAVSGVFLAARKPDSAT